MKKKDRDYDDDGGGGGREHWPRQIVQKRQ